MGQHLDLNPPPMPVEPLQYQQQQNRPSSRIRPAIIGVGFVVAAVRILGGALFFWGAGAFGKGPFTRTVTFFSSIERAFDYIISAAAFSLGISLLTALIGLCFRQKWARRFLKLSEISAIALNLFATAVSLYFAFTYRNPPTPLYKVYLVAYQIVHLPTAMIYSMFTLILIKAVDDVPNELGEPG